MGIWTKRAEATEAGISAANYGRARDRASKLSTDDLTAWTETTTMNIGASIAAYRQTGNPDHLHEAMIMNESLHGMLINLVERQPL